MLVDCLSAGAVARSCMRYDWARVHAVGLRTVERRADRLTEPRKI